MSSGQGQRSGLSKAANVQNQPAPASIGQAHFPSADVGSQRRTAGSPGGGAPSKSNPSPRNNQSRKNQHKRHRRPRLADEDAFAESVAMKSTTSRRGQTSITHLMNFALPARPSPHHYHHTTHSSYRGPRRPVPWGARSSYYTVDKSRYVHANYRFIVNSQNNYHAQATNADIHLDWDAVLQILVSTITQDASCPICLCSPVAPRMAKCGHIFCLPCLIRYMHSTDDTNPVPEKKARWKKCPICWDSVYLSETRPVAWYRGQQTDSLFEGGDVVLRLVSRRPGSTLALPRDGAENIETDEDIPWHHIADVPDYARIMKGGEDYMTSQYDAEIDALRQQEQEDELYFEEDGEWTQKAIASIRDAKDRIRGIGNPPDVASQPVQPRSSRPALQFEQPEEGVPDMYLVQRAAKSGQSSSNASNAQLISQEHTSPAADQTSWPVDSAADVSTALSKTTISENNKVAQDDEKQNASRGKSPVRTNNASLPHPPDQPYYFYQALPHFYLSSLDIRILKAAFGEFSQFPSTILPRIEHISTGHIVDEDLRKRTKYLSHLPFGCEVSFLECDWTDLVSEAVLEKFSAEITRRRRRNMEKAAREEKESVRAEKEEEKRWTATRKRRSSIPESAIVDRPFSESDFQPLGLDAADSAAAAEQHPGDTGMSSASPPRGGHHHHSFAALQSPSSSPPTQRTVWGTTAIAPSSGPAPSSEPTTTQQPKDDGWLNNWEDELVAEQHGMALGGGGGGGGGNGAGGASGGGGGGKKKKGKKITLMSTNARRAA